MITRYNKYFFIILLLAFSLFLLGCGSQEESEAERLRRLNQKGEYIYRIHDELLFSVAPPQLQQRPPYPWESDVQSKYPRITKEFFRCKGSTLNPSRLIQNSGKEPVRYHDCGGAEKHSLPLRNDKEFIYPILMDLLNEIQQQTGKRVVITAGHRCPEHQAYADPSPEGRTSKHLIGAEVSFYVQGMEHQPEVILQHLFAYYKKQPKYQGLREFQEFSRYEKTDVNVSTPPWMNKEIFIKFFKKNEGRNFDNRHPYPYFSIQVRYDWDIQQKVSYSWEAAQKRQR